MSDYQKHLDEAYADLRADGGLPEARRASGLAVELGQHIREFESGGETFTVADTLSLLRRVSAALADRDARIERLTAELADLREAFDSALGQISQAREACPVVRMQDYVDAPLLVIVKEQVSQLFRMQSRAEKAEAALASATERHARIQGHAANCVAYLQHELEGCERAMNTNRSDHAQAVGRTLQELLREAISRLGPAAIRHAQEGEK